MAKELDKVIKVGDDEYNINAVEAEHVKAKININKVNLSDRGEETPSTTNVVSFNGSNEVNLDLVTAEGGRFRKRIAVPADTRSMIDDEAVLNYGDIKNVILRNVKNNAIVYKWNGSEQSVAFNNSINSISIVQGDEADVDKFAEYNNSQYNKYVTDKTTYYLPTYLYIGSQQNKVYYGTADSNEAVLLAINSAGVVAEAKKLASPISMRINLESPDSVSFNGDETTVITPGVTGKLLFANGGLNGDISASTQAAKRAEYYINGSISEDSTNAVTDDTWMLFGQKSPSTNNGQYCRKKASSLLTYIAGKLGFNSSKKILSIDNGGTGASSLTDITVGNANKLNGQEAIYYQKKIHTGSNTPTNASIGDIWIKY